MPYEKPPLFILSDNRGLHNFRYALARYDSWEEKHDAVETMLETIDNLLENVEEGKEHLEDLIGELPFLILDSEQYAQDDISFKSLAIALKLATLY